MSKTDRQYNAQKKKYKKTNNIGTYQNINKRVCFSVTTNMREHKECMNN